MLSDVGRTWSKKNDSKVLIHLMGKENDKEKVNGYII